MAFTTLEENTKIRASVLNDNFEAVRQETTAKVAQAKAEILSNVSDYQDDIDAAISAMNTTVANCVTISGTQNITGNKTFKGTAKAKHQGGLSTPSGDGKILTTVNCNIDNNHNGFVSLGNGLIIQWGKCDVPSTVSLPTAFSNKNYRVAVSMTSPVDDGHWQNLAITSIEKTTFKIKMGNHNDYTCGAMWLAVGN